MNTIEGGFRKNEFIGMGAGKNKPVISIITVVYNNATFIEKTILSVTEQSYPFREYIIIDGGSTDGTTDIIKRYSHKIDYWLSEPDKGIYDAMNKGLRLAKGEYIMFLNSGDLLNSRDTLANVFSSASDADVYYGETNLIKEDGSIMGTRSELTTRKLPDSLTWKDMKWGMVVSHQSVIVKRSLAPMYNLKYRYSADIEWVIQSLKKSRNIVNTNMVISDYLVGGLSFKNRKQSWSERFQIYIHHYGIVNTIIVHFAIIFKNLIFSLKNKRNY